MEGSRKPCLEFMAPSVVGSREVGGGGEFVCVGGGGRGGGQGPDSKH